MEEQKLEWYQNPTITSEVQKALKRSNQRIVQLTKQFGKKSSIYKQAVGKFNAKPYKKYMSTSKAGKKVAGNITKGGMRKFDVKKINTAIRSGKVSRSDINRILINAAGIRITEEGKVVEVQGDGAGVPTVTGILEKTKKKLNKKNAEMGEAKRTYTKEELKREAEEFAEFSESFQTTYNAYNARFTEDEKEDFRQNSIIGQLYGDSKHKRGFVISRKDITKIKEEMERLLKESVSQALDFESENTEET